MIKDIHIQVAEEIAVHLQDAIEAEDLNTADWNLLFRALAAVSRALARGLSDTNDEFFARLAAGDVIIPIEPSRGLTHEDQS